MTDDTRKKLEADSAILTVKTKANNDTLLRGHREYAAGHTKETFRVSTYWLEKQQTAMCGLLKSRRHDYMNNDGRKAMKSLIIVHPKPSTRRIGRAMQMHSTSKTSKTIAQTGNLSFFIGGVTGVAGVPT